MTHRVYVLLSLSVFPSIRHLSRRIVSVISGQFELPFFYILLFCKQKACFQSVMTSDARTGRSYILFNYHSINWTFHQVAAQGYRGLSANHMMHTSYNDLSYQLPTMRGNRGIKTSLCVYCKVILWSHELFLVTDIVSRLSRLTIYTIHVWSCRFSIPYDVCLCNQSFIILFYFETERYHIIGESVALLVARRTNNRKVWVRGLLK